MRPIKIPIGFILAVIVIACVALGTHGQSPVTGVLSEKPVDRLEGGHSKLQVVDSDHRLRFNKNDVGEIDNGRIAVAIGLDITFTIDDQTRYRKWSAEMTDAHIAEVRIRYNNRTVEMTFEEFWAKVGLGDATKKGN